MVDQDNQLQQSGAFSKVEHAETQICEILDMFCGIQSDLHKQLAAREEVDRDSNAGFNLDGSSMGKAAADGAIDALGLNFMSASESKRDAENDQKTQCPQRQLEEKISKIGSNLKSIQENLHLVVNSIQTLESSKQPTYQLIRD